MAIQPIDLQAMYNQMHNVAQTVSHQQHGVKLAESIQQQNMIQQNMEASKRVQQTTNDNSQASLVRDNGGNSGMQHHGKKRDSREEDGQENLSEQNNIRDPCIGRLIDITR